MKNKLKTSTPSSKHWLLKTAGAVAAAGTLLATPAQAALWGRDINGYAVANNVAVFLYEPDSNITWLRDAAPLGRVNIHDAFFNTHSIRVGIFDGWRLPGLIDTGPHGCTSETASTWDCGYEPPTGTSEMAHLWYDELGNKAFCTPITGTCGAAGWGLANTGDFSRMQADRYWIGSSYYPFTSDTTGPYGWGFNAGDGFQYGYDGYSEFFTMAVRDGDVLVERPDPGPNPGPGPGPGTSVPEPGTLLLAALAFASLALTTQRRGLNKAA